MRRFIFYESENLPAQLIWLIFLLQNLS